MRFLQLSLTLLTMTTPLLDLAEAISAQDLESFAHIKSLGLQKDRVGVYRSLAKESQQQFWVHKVQEYRKENLGTLTDGQRSALDAAIDFFKSRDFSKEDEMGKKVVDAFGHVQAKEILASIGGEPEKRGLEKRYDDDDICDCCKDCSDWWCGSDNCHTADCIILGEKCGAGWNYDCDGRCS